MNAQVWYRHALLNRLQSLALLGAIGGFMALLGWLVWGVFGVIGLLLVAMWLLLFNPAARPQLIMRMYRASLLTSWEAPGLQKVLHELARRAELPAVPELYYVPSRMVNAFAVGTPGQAAIAVTDGLLRALDLREIAGVLAHEVSHIRNNDLRVMGIADLFSRLTSFLSLFGQILLLLNLPLLLLSGMAINWFAILVLIFAPSLSVLAQLGLSRTREYDADLNAAQLTGDPEGLARALVKIERVHGSFLERLLLPGRGIPEPSTLRTHPRTEDRVRRLMELRPGGPTAWAEQSDLLSVPRDPLRASPVQLPRWHINGLWH